MQPLQNRWPHGVCTASRRAIRQMGHSYLLSRGGSNSTSYPCVSSEKEPGAFPALLPMLELSSLAAALQQALAMAAQQPLSPSRPPQLPSLCSKLMAAGRGHTAVRCNREKRWVHLEYFRSLPPRQEQKLFPTRKTGTELQSFAYLVICRKGHCILST